MHDPSKLPSATSHELPKGAPKIAGKVGGELANYAPAPDHEAFRKGEEVTPELARRLIHGYYASTSYVDAQIGVVLDELRRLGLEQTTNVVLWGDHGFHLGDHGIWTKHTNYEQANRIPLVIAAPGITRPGASTEQPTESVDIFATLAELTGLPPPTGQQPIDGVSLLPVLREPAAWVKDHAYHCFPRQKMGRAIRTATHRLVEWKKPGAKPETAELELYDLQSDPEETRNVASDQPEIVRKMCSILARHPEAVVLPAGSH
jgi:iduronate 2-sulfatase